MARRRSLSFESLERRVVLSASAHFGDYTGDGVPSPRDALLLVNAYNRHSREADTDGRLDFNGDGRFADDDVEEVIDQVGRAMQVVREYVHRHGLRDSAREIPQLPISPFRIADAQRQLSKSGSTEPIYVPQVAKIEPSDPGITPQTSQSTGIIDLDDFRNDVRFADIDGEGFAAVVLDTGIDLDHPYFGPDDNNDNISDRIVYSWDFADNDSNAGDFHDHGSNVTSIVASSDNTHTGMAPKADIIHLKVFPNSGGGASNATLENALQWVVDNAATYNIASVNMSLGSGNPDYYNNVHDLHDEMLALAKLDIITAVASGNSFFSVGSTQGRSFPSADPMAISVGATYDANIGSVSYSSGATANTTAIDRITPFTQRQEDFLDILAPGAPITGANRNGGTTSMHGTSQASPHIAGIAVLAQELAVQEWGRRMTLDEFRKLIQQSGVTLNDGDDENDNVTNTNVDFKRVDVLALGEAILALKPGSIAGQVFEDQNGDGDKTGDPGVDAWEVFVDSNANQTLESGTSSHTSTTAVNTIDLETVYASQTVSGIAGVITDVNVTLTMTHTWDADLGVSVIAPDGTRVELFAEVGGSSNNFTDTELDDEAGTSITSGSAPFTGSFRPTGSLSELDGLAPNGTWKLEITDNFNLDDGTLSEWTLDIAYAELSETSDTSGNFAFDGLTAATYEVLAESQSGWTQTAPASTGHSVALTAGEVAVDKDFGVTDTPLIMTQTPSDDATGQAVDVNLVIDYSEDVQKGTGDILIKRSSDDVTVETIDVTSGSVSISGDQVTIDPPNDLDEATEYYVQIAATAIEDLAGNDHLGIADTTSWSFTTHDVTPPTIKSVRVGSDSWTTSFKNVVDTISSPGIAYAMPENASQLDNLTWTEINEIYIEFSEDVSASFTKDNIAFVGTTLADYEPNATLTYGQEAVNVGKIALSSPIANDALVLAVFDTLTDAAGNSLNGEWTDGTSTESGTGGAGGHFYYRFDVLPGDVNDSNGVNSTDIIVTRAAGGTVISDPADASVDVNGNGGVNSIDLTLVRNQGGTVLPAPPSNPTP